MIVIVLATVLAVVAALLALGGWFVIIAALGDVAAERRGWRLIRYGLALVVAAWLLAPW